MPRRNRATETLDRPTSSLTFLSFVTCSYSAPLTSTPPASASVSWIMPTLWRASLPFGPRGASVWGGPAAGPPVWGNKGLFLAVFFLGSREEPWLRPGSLWSCFYCSLCSFAQLRWDLTSPFLTCLHLQAKKKKVKKMGYLLWLVTLHL